MKRGTQIKVKFFSSSPLLPIAIIAFVLIISVTIILIFFVPSGQVWQTSLLTSALPTAEALLNAPKRLDIPSAHVELSYTALPTYSEENIKLCIRATSNIIGQEGMEDFQSNSQLFVNNSGIFNLDLDVGVDANPYQQWCATGNLASGLHLIEFHLRDESGETLHIQQWAIEVE